jgi:hypothetical protein
MLNVSEDKEEVRIEDKDEKFVLQVHGKTFVSQ